MVDDFSVMRSLSARWFRLAVNAALTGFTNGERQVEYCPWFSFIGPSDLWRSLKAWLDRPTILVADGDHFPRGDYHSLTTSWTVVAPGTLDNAISTLRGGYAVHAVLARRWGVFDTNQAAQLATVYSALRAARGKKVPLIFLGQRDCLPDYMRGDSCLKSDIRRPYSSRRLAFSNSRSRQASLAFAP